MITPRFQIEQTDSDLIFTINAPYASIADAEIYADLDIFCFYASPYYLRLHLSGHIEETDFSKGSYDADKGTFVICVQKVNKGEHFENLDFVTSLLTPSQHKKSDIAKPIVEVVSESVEKDENEEEECSENGDEWYIEQCPFEEPTEDFLLTAPNYGFGNKLSGVFQNFKSEFLEVIELPEPDKTAASERGRMRTMTEINDFSDDHYLADWAQSDIIEPLINYNCAWQNKVPVTFLDEEVDILKDLPKKEFLLDQREEHSACLSLIDILFAYAYNVRTTLGENTVESAWTVNKLSATLSWLQNLSTLKEATSVPIRRSLCYPLYRHWDLSMKVLNDVKDILKLGKKQILKSLLEVYTLFNMSEPRYVLNQLYIRDYCIWIQRVPDSKIKSLSVALDKVEISKSDVDLDLDDLEKAAKIVEMEEEIEKKKKLMNGQNSSSQKVIKEQELCKDIATLSLANKSDKLDSSSDTADSEDDSSSSEEEDSSSSSSDLDSDDLSEEELGIKQ